MQKEKELENIYGYQLVTELTSKNSGFGRWGFAVKDGRDYFIKEFLAPVWPEDGLPISDTERRRRTVECQVFYQNKLKLYEAIKKANNGNIVQIEAFFKYKTHFYVVTDKVNTTTIGISEIAELPEEKKELLLKVLTHCIHNLSNEGVVHGDLKPDNILVKKTAAGFYTMKLIDFDSSFFEDTEITDADEVQGDTVYLAPETFLCMIGECNRITVKADVFALGILFHQYLSGTLPSFAEEYDYLYEAVLDEAEYQLNPSIPDKYQKLIRKMLEKDPEKLISIDQVNAIIIGQQEIEPTEEEEDFIYIPDNNSENIRVEDFYNIDADGWESDPSASWDMPDKPVTAQSLSKDETFNDREPGVVKEKSSPIIVNGLKMSGNLHKNE